LRYTFAGKSKVIDIIDSIILEDIKARLRSRDRLVILEFTNKEDKSREGRGIDRENNGDKEDKSREGSGIDRENDGDEEDKSREGSGIDRENDSENKDD
jgi:hypothetical protein